MARGTTEVEGTEAVAKPARKTRTKAATVSADPATPREVREYLLSASLPAGVTVGARGRLSQSAKDFFTAQTGRPIVVAE
jgi:hypothetical protein